MEKEKSKKEVRTLFCHNDILNAIKKHNPRQLMLFYEMIRAYKHKALSESGKEYIDQFDFDEEITMNIKQIKTSLGILKISKDRLDDLIDDTISVIKINKTWIYIFSYKEIRECDDGSCLLCFKLNPEFTKRILNRIDGTYSVMELEKLTNIRTKHGQRLYELYLRYKNQGLYKMPIEEFKEYMGLSEIFKMSNLEIGVISPGIKDLKKNKINIQINKIRNGRKITHLLFIFKKGEDDE